MEKNTGNKWNYKNNIINFRPICFNSQTRQANFMFNKTQNTKNVSGIVILLDHFQKRIVDNAIISSNLYYCMSTLIWVVSKINQIRSGISKAVT